MVEINLNISGTLADFEYASKVYCVTSKDEEYVLTLASSVLNRDEKYKKYSVIKDENENELAFDVDQVAKTNLAVVF